LTINIKTDMRKRLLCCASLADFIQENSNFGLIVKDAEIEEKSDLCGKFAAMFDVARSVREKIQVLTFFREKNCRIPDVNDEQLKAVVIEFGNEFGVDALAVYSDSQVAWYSGKDNALLEFEISKDVHPAYDQLWGAADRGSQHAISHPTEIPTLPPPGYILISFLSKNGIAFGTGASRDIASDSVTGPLIHAALGLRKVALALN
jgi:hypothetical protein